MKKVLLASCLALGLATTFTSAKADFILSDNTFADLGGTGFGVLPRLLTIQAQGNTGVESGAVISQGGTQAFLSPATINGTTLVGIQCNTQNACNGFGGGLDVTQSNLVNIATFGWTSGANVGVGLDTNQTGSSTGLLFTGLLLNIYDAAGNIVGSFGSANSTAFITPEQLALQQGNGNSVFNLLLTQPEQATFDAMLAANPGSLFAGLAASFGCTPTPCLGAADDGAESFLGFNQAAVPGPIVGAGLPGLVSGAFGIWLFGRRRINKWRGIKAA